MVDTVKRTSEHEAAIAILKEPGGKSLLVEPWDEGERLVNEARYQAVSTGRFPDEPEQLAAHWGPVFATGGQASLEGIRVTVTHALHEAPFVMDFPKEIAAARGTELAAALIQQKVLLTNDKYRIVFLAAPRQSPESPSEDELYEAPFPVRQVSLEHWGIGQALWGAVDSNRPVFVHRQVLESAVAAAEQNPEQEVGTLLLGELVQAPELSGTCQSHWAVVVTEQVAVENGVGTAATYTFPPESFRRARQLAQLRQRHESVVGSQHSHGFRCGSCPKRSECQGSSIFFSAQDDRMAQQFPVYAVFLVVGGDPTRDRQHPVVDLFVRRNGLMRQASYAVFG